jgi:hypothetical protein
MDFDAMAEEKFVVKICWGSFNAHGNGRYEWIPNRKLKLSHKDQYEQNKENGCFEGMSVISMCNQ